MDKFLQVAIDEAKKGAAEGGIPIGSVLVIDGAIVGRGHMATGFLPYVQDERYVAGAWMRRSDLAKYRPSMDITAGCSRAVRSCMRRWIAWRMPGG